MRKINDQTKNINNWQVIPKICPVMTDEHATLHRTLYLRFGIK